MSFHDPQLRCEETPLRWTDLLGHPPMAIPPFKKDMDVNKADEEGNTPLHEAVRYGNIIWVKRLIRNGADVNRANNSGWTPLHMASYHGHGRTAMELLKAGARVDEVNGIGETPLFWAVRGNQLGLVKLLVEAGADINKAHKWGGTPLSLAQTLSREACMKYFRFVSGPWTLGRKSNLAEMPVAARRRAFTAILCLTRLGMDPYIIQKVLGHCHSKALYGSLVQVFKK
jgi:hypothetical protein